MSEMPAFVIHTLLPVRTYESPSRTARVVIEATSLPASASDRQYEPCDSPLATRGRYVALELLAREVGDRQRRQLRDQQHQARRRAHPRELLRRDRLRHEVGPRASVLDRQAERGQLHRHQRVECVPVVSGEVVGLRGPRSDLVLAELPHDLPELALLVGERDGLHAPSVAPRRSRRRSEAALG